MRPPLWAPSMSWGAPKRLREFDRDSGLTRYKVQGGRKTGLMPKPLVDAYLRRNPVMREAWEASGYRLGE